MDWKKAIDNEIVCYCQNVNKGIIVSAVKSGTITLALVKDATSACTGGNCKELNPSDKCCSGDILELIKIYSDDSKESESSCCCCNS
ncbi:MAG: (2Fe-2S)-binding protein [Spirochaetales bacterium]|nr:(2Fe-2S)-binding protein [Spirochaetales bacterium]